MRATIRQLQAFVAVARCGSFTKASRELHLTQSAVSLLVKELESIIGAQLLDRSRRNAQVTDVGEELLEGASRLLGDLDHLLANVGQLVNKQRGRVVLAAPLVLSGTYLPPILRDFNMRYPGIELVLKDALPDQVLPMVTSMVADIGIGTFRHADHGLHAELLFKEALVAMFPVNHFLNQQPRLTWRDLRDVPVLTLPSGSVFRDLAESGFRAAKIPLRPVFEATYVGTLVGLVRAGFGVAVVPGYATSLIDPNVIAFKRLESPLVKREVIMVHRGVALMSPAARAFASFVADMHPG